MKEKEKKFKYQCLLVLNCFNTCIIFTIQSLKIMLQNNFKRFRVIIYTIFVMTQCNNFDYFIDLFILRGCLCLSTCIYVWRCTHATEIWKSWFFLSIMKVTRMEFRSGLVTDQTNLFIDPFDQSSICSHI